MAAQQIRCTVCDQVFTSHKRMRMHYVLKHEETPQAGTAGKSDDSETPKGKAPRPTTRAGRAAGAAAGGDSKRDDSDALDFLDID